jgi:monoamine oxidase
VTKFLGPAAGEPTEYVERDGAGSALVEPAERIHWAGAETSDVWNGSMEGAIRSGLRAATEVLADL